MAEGKKPPFLGEFRVQDNAELAADVLALTMAMRATPEVWAIFERVTDRLDMTEEEIAACGRFEIDFFAKLEKKRPIDASLSMTVLRQLAAGKIESLSGEEASNFFKQRCHFK
jgi:hypothetical protein